MKHFCCIFLLSVLTLLPGCKTLRGLIDDGEVVARIGAHKFYRSDLERMIPNGTAPADSAKLALLYINAWAKDKAFLDVAEQQLSKEEKDVTEDLEVYREALLRYRYEQRFINERLDTAVSRQQISDYYDAHPGSFILERPIFKARFLSIDRDSPNLPVIRKLMSSDKLEDVLAADSIAFNSAKYYHDYSRSWIDALTLASEFGLDEADMLSRRKGNFIEYAREDGTLNLAYLAGTLPAGQTAPVEFCGDRIRDILLSGRKHDLLSTLEQDLIEDAKNRENFVIYSK